MLNDDIRKDAHDIRVVMLGLDEVASAVADMYSFALSFAETLETSSNAASTYAGCARIMLAQTRRCSDALTSLVTTGLRLIKQDGSPVAHESRKVSAAV